MLVVAAGHSDADDPVLAHMAAVLIRMGAHVVIDSAGDNLIELVGSGAHRIATVRAQGLANLVHELVHVFHAGRLADDHAIDYGAIPFDLTTRAGRTLLWQELSCCIVSCAYVRDECRVRPWFLEQVEIQPVFYGMEHHVQEFFAEVERLTNIHRDTLDAVVAESYRRVEAEMVACGAPARLAHPRRRLGFCELWPAVRERAEDLCADVG